MRSWALRQLGTSSWRCALQTLAVEFHQEDLRLQQQRLHWSCHPTWTKEIQLHRNSPRVQVSSWHSVSQSQDARASPADFTAAVTAALFTSYASGQEGPASPTDTGTFGCVVVLCLTNSGGRASPADLNFATPGGRAFPADFTSNTAAAAICSAAKVPCGVRKLGASEFACRGEHERVCARTLLLHVPLFRTRPPACVILFHGPIACAGSELAAKSVISRFTGRIVSVMSRSRVMRNGHHRSFKTSCLSHRYPPSALKD